MTAGLFAFPVLAVFSARDLDCRRLPREWLLVYSAAGLCAAAARRGFGSLYVLGDMVPGLFLLFSGALTRQSIGYGDGWLVLAGGLLTGGGAAAETLFLALFLAAVWSIVLLATRRGTGRTRLPFVPFLAAGEGLRLILACLLRQGAG